MTCGECVENKGKIPSFQPQCWTGVCPNASCMYEGVSEWFAFWQRWRFCETVQQIGGVRWLRFAGMYNAETIEFLMELDLCHENMKAKLQKQK